MHRVQKYLHRRLTGREAAGVIVLVVVLAGFGYLAYNFVIAQILEVRVVAAIPKVCADIRVQRGKLVRAIEAYKAHFGVYPPDHVVSRQPLVVDVVKNQLLYELVGVIYNRTNNMFEVDRLEPADAKYVKGFFHCDGFKNSAEKRDQVKRFLTDDPLPTRQLHDDPDVFAVGFHVPYEGLAPEVVWEFDVSPWRYVSTSPTNNPGRFDLWIEIEAGNRKITIGNWAAVE